ncbi:hypothetical protein DEJ21_14080 [Curtobacterium sp. MCSS17_006]|uniref:hypothetical protein n=1 Tax=Curtobacterium sp. MCSS17_006 TaxID=2175642 RepID=UPI000DAABAC3|nr:hypothetical protein [Curtobacterium sp. MCSS17_006]PZE33973.1 hypothetical protein DEJ21_14080 [Curtobacterium sp. MCSS17_006]
MITEHTITLTTIECANCHMTFGVPELWEKDRRRKHDGFYCPNGHPLVFNGESDVDKERRLRKAAERSRDYARVAREAAEDQAAAAERSSRSYRGHLTRLRNKIANGVCPVPNCRRSFQNVREHIAGQHPEWAHEHTEAMSA